MGTLFEDENDKDMLDDGDWAPSQHRFDAPFDEIPGNGPIFSKGLHDDLHDFSNFQDFDGQDDMIDYHELVNPSEISMPRHTTGFAPFEDTTSGSCSSMDSPEFIEEPAPRTLSKTKLPPLSYKPSKVPKIKPLPLLSTAASSLSATPLAERECHNAMERLRRVNIRLCFESLQNAVPELRCKKAHTLHILQVD